MRRPLGTLAAWLVAIVLLAALGLGVESRLTQSVFILPGTETDRAYDLAADEFGESVIIPVLLEGPERAIDEQGPALVAALSSNPDVRVLSPWDRGSGVERLRPSSEAALILATYDIPFEEAFDTLAPEVRSAVDETIGEPVEARITGMPIIGNDIKQETYDSADRAELIALPILLVVLLLVFRAPIAALIPALTGLSTLFASAGVIWLAAGALDVDPIAVALASMMGLALGVDYSLLIVSRFREELAAGLDGRAAVLRSMATAGRTVLFAGVALIAAMLVALLVVPGALLLSAAVGVMASTILSMIAAFVAMPAALALVGTRIDAGRIGSGAAGTPAWLALVGGVLKRPGVAAIAILLPLLLFAVPAMALNTGPPDVEQLPEDSRARTDYERVRAVMGPGWAAPFEVIAVAEEGTITEPKRLRRIRRFQRDLYSQDAVLNVVGPGRLAQQSKRAQRSEGALRRGRRGLVRLRRGLRRAELGLAEATGGIGEAAVAADRLGAGGADAAGGAAELSDRLTEAAAGTELIGDALTGAEDGTQQLVDGLAQALDAYQELIPEVGFLKDKVSLELRNGARAVAGSLRNSVENLDDLTDRSEVITDDVEEALRQVEQMSTGRSDPAYPALRSAVLGAYLGVTGTNPISGQQIDPAYRGLTGQLEFISISVSTEVKNARRLVDASRELASGIGELKQALDQLRSGTRELLGGAEQLSDGIAQGEEVIAELTDGLLLL
ncbi:MAG TPA: MMPL family transporter, partial [Solirubrobacterales bacterium]|nr:MMPL family transporter [Solirubrobacterales bacterium]